MASCAFIVLCPSDAGGDLSNLVEGTTKMLGSPHSGFAPDIFVGLDDANGNTVQWAVQNSTFERLYVTKGHIGHPLLLNTILDQVIELGELDYDYIGIVEAGVVLRRAGWLRDAMDVLSDEMSDYAVNLGHLEDYESLARTLKIGETRWIVPNIGHLGCIVPTGALRDWRAVPYGALYGRFWGDLSDHLNSRGVVLVSDVSWDPEHPLAGRSDGDTLVSVDTWHLEGAHTDG